MERLCHEHWISASLDCGENFYRVPGGQNHVAQAYCYKLCALPVSILGWSHIGHGEQNRFLSISPRIEDAVFKLSLPSRIRSCIVTAVWLNTSSPLLP